MRVLQHSNNTQETTVLFFVLFSIVCPHSDLLEYLSSILLMTLPGEVRPGATNAPWESSSPSIRNRRSHSGASSVPPHSSIPATLSLELPVQDWCFETMGGVK
ncbi:synapse differentiation-inducing protein 1 [Platysternon megacephalum]|uniref:Synapse differentiation-inducing protein 1 n=1 Tax=Platysternon megacephalum TaxID=55544 RepID=A0A4D9E5W7_9SAUR|nr:synapse differentiation-inducing protein 1 [Platysternon megacephalum]